ncbi:butyrophilin subfamily 1 member A1-like [Hypomesus transpacificus]|uniref:butyrophilin subfamily 1 member A1-like n=1 Tax=Hypomesus transpacificus TaxID=137520 RepID=UPI001F083611|nr:butyrophilin subfamily 1 member A1-like [Hypomesus transpacificus]
MLVLLCLLVLLIPGGSPAGESRLIGSLDRIVAVEGDYVILPCSLEPSIDAEFLTVEWSRPDLEPAMVQFYRDGRNLQGGKNPSYKYRTMLFEDELVRGNVSLKLFRVKLEDEGSYTCLVIKDGQVQKTVIQLSVGEVSKPEVSIVGAREDGVGLQCESGGWYPEPELEWRDSKGRLLPADVPQTDRLPDPGPHQRYTVTSRVTVQKTDTNRFTCRVHLQRLNQTRKTEIHVPDDLCQPCPKPNIAVPVSVTTGVLFLVILVTCVAVYYLRSRIKHTASSKRECVELDDRDSGTGDYPLRNR